MRRQLSNVLAALSLVLCVAVVALWVRSYWRADWLGWYTSVTEFDKDIRWMENSLYTEFCGLQSSNGGIACGSNSMKLVRTTPAVFAQQWMPVPDAEGELRW